MRCEDALERMLEADPSTLRGDRTADPELAAHLRDCARCRAVAMSLKAELASLDVGLDELANGSPGIRWPGRGTAAKRRGDRRLWVPLAAAAGLAAVLVLGRNVGQGPSAGQDPRTADAVQRARVAVTLPADRGGAVMNTNDPNITVVWLYERSDP